MLQARRLAQLSSRLRPLTRTFAVRPQETKSPQQTWEERWEWNQPFSNPNINEIERYHNKKREQLVRETQKQPKTWKMNPPRVSKLRLKNTSSPCAVLVRGLSSHFQQQDSYKTIQYVFSKYEQSIVNTIFLTDEDGYATGDVVLEFESEGVAKSALSLNGKQVFEHQLEEEMADFINKKQDDLRLYQGYIRYRETGRADDWWDSQLPQNPQIAHDASDKQKFLRVLNSRFFEEQNIDLDVNPEKQLPHLKDEDVVNAIEQKNGLQQKYHSEKEHKMKEIRKLREQVQEDQNNLKLKDQLDRALNDYLNTNEAQSKELSEHLHGTGLEMVPSQIDVQAEINKFRTQLQKQGRHQDDIRRLVRLYEREWKKIASGLNRTDYLPKFDLEEFLEAKSEDPIGLSTVVGRNDPADFYEEEFLEESRAHETSVDRCSQTDYVMPQEYLSKALALQLEEKDKAGKQIFVRHLSLEECCEKKWQVEYFTNPHTNVPNKDTESN